MKAIQIKPLPNYQLQIDFEDGVSGKIDLKELVQRGIFKVLQNDTFFNQVNFNASAIFWSDELEIDLVNVYMELSGKNLDEIFPKVDYATN